MLKRVVGVGLPIFGLVAVIAMMVVASNGVSVAVIDTKGVIGNAQRDILYFAVLVMLIVVVPVFVLVAFISWRYRDAAKRKALYRPEWASNTWLEVIWWGVPLIIIVVLSVITWQTSHSLDPYRPLSSAKKPVQVQVVALQWKWLFIYPEEGIATVNELAMPVDTPVEFTITSDAPMNSFWIPQLGGQIYAMAGMQTKLRLNANMPGNYSGVSANYSGEGHSSMRFIAKARTQDEYNMWIKNAQKTNSLLNKKEYEKLRMPSKKDEVTFYRIESNNLFNRIVGRYSGSHSMMQQNMKMKQEGHR